MVIAVDRPVDLSERDELNRAALVERLAATLVDEKADGTRTSTELVVGLVGQWGSGKSTILNGVGARLIDQGAVVVRFNPWAFTDHEALLFAFFEEMRLQFAESSSEKVRRIADSVDSYREALEPVSAALPFPLSVLLRIKLKRRVKSLAAEKSVLEKKLKEAGQPIVVLIDDLDRLDSDGVVAIARFIKLISDFPNISYLIAYDRIAVEFALGKVSNSGQEYLKKLVQLVVPIRMLMDYEIIDMLEKGLSGAGYSEDLDDEDLFRRASEQLKNLIETPRDIRRLVATFAALEPVVRYEVHPVELLCYCLICNQFPDERDKIERSAQAITGARAAGETGRSKIDEIFDQSDYRVRDLLKFLFRRPHETGDDKRFGLISNYSNLLKLLYVGSPPTLVPRAVVAEFWTAENKADVFEHHVMQRSEDAFLQTLEENLGSLDSKGDLESFFVLSDDAPHPDRTVWPRQIEWLDRLKFIILRMLNLDRGAERARSILYNLLERERFSVFSDLFRYHLFAFGMSEGFERRGGPTLIEESEVRSLLKDVAARFREMVIDGSVFSAPFYSDVFYALLQTSNWDEKLKSASTSHLIIESNAENFCMTFARPSFQIEPDIIGKFVDLSVLERILTSLTASDEFSKGCVDRMLAGIRKRDLGSAEAPK